MNPNFRRRRMTAIMIDVRVEFEKATMIGWQRLTIWSVDVDRIDNVPYLDSGGEKKYLVAGKSGYLLEKGDQRIKILYSQIQDIVPMEEIPDGICRCISYFGGIEVGQITFGLEFCQLCRLSNSFFLFILLQIPWLYRLWLLYQKYKPSRQASAEILQTQ